MCYNISIFATLVAGGGKMAWEYLGLNKEPFLSINPLLMQEELAYFVNREKELQLLKRYFDTNISQHILISGKAGLGKTSLVCYLGIPRENEDFIRINLSESKQQEGQILDLITHDLLEFGCRLKIKGAENLGEDFLYCKKETEEMAGDIKAGVIIEGKVSSKKGTEKTRRRLPFDTEQILGKILVAVTNHIKHPPIIFIDESDHLPESTQETILLQIESLLVSNKCKVFFTTRKEIENIFLGDVNSKYRSRFTDIIPLGPIKPSAGSMAKLILEKRFEPCAGENYQYPFAEETNIFLEDVSNGSIRELLRYTSFILSEASASKLLKPINVDFAFKVLSEKQLLASGIESKEYQIMKILELKPLSPSDKILQEKTLFKRATLNILLTELDKKGFTQKICEGKKILHKLTPKGKWVLKSYEITRL